MTGRKSEAENLETAKAQQAGAPPPEPKKRPRSDNVLAAQLVDKLCAIDADEAEELAQAPATVKARHDARRVKLLESASQEVRALVGRLRGQ